MQNNLLLIISLLFAVSMLSMLSAKLKVAYPIFLVIAGLGISLIPGIPHISLDPNLVFIICLPPLLYAAAWNTSWREFWFYRRPIIMLAFGLVITTSIAIAVVAHALIPGFTLALGFLLGGIVSPPDAVAATSVTQGLKIPKEVTTILEGESLVNDASSLIVFRVALTAIVTGQFVWWHTGIDFFIISAMGILTGLAIAHIAYAVHRYLPTTPSIDTAISFITPYLAYILAEHFEWSGVLAVVSAGLFLTFRSQDIFSYNSRLQVVSVWNTIVFLLNGIVFILIGLQLPDIIRSLDGYAIGEVVGYAVIISLVTIAVRMAWVFPGYRISRWLHKKSGRSHLPDPGWKPVFLIAWSGMRGVVSLASALSVPLTLTNETAFPHRNLILFITFVVILFTLVLQGLSLPFLVHKLNIETNGENEETLQRSIHVKLATKTIDYLNNKYADRINDNEGLRRLKERYENIVELANRETIDKDKKNNPTFNHRTYVKIMLDIVQLRREALRQMRHTNEYPEEIIKNVERELDLEESRLRK